MPSGMLVDPVLIQKLQLVNSLIKRNHNICSADFESKFRVELCKVFNDDFNNCFID